MSNYKAVLADKANNEQLRAFLKIEEVDFACHFVSVQTKSNVYKENSILKYYKSEFPSFLQLKLLCTHYNSNNETVFFFGCIIRRKMFI